MSVTGIILVAGSSTRFAKGTNKNLEQINKKYILEYSLEQFINNELIDDIIIALREEEKIFIEKIASKYKGKTIKFVKGGQTRQESVYNCIKQSCSDIVIIHDGARPLIKQKYIDECIITMEKYEGATVAVKSKDTIKISDDNNIVIQTTERKNTWIIQTPQCFKRKILLEAHEKFKNNETVTDDCMLLEMYGKKIKLIEGDYTNIKVTTPEDMKLVQQFLDEKIK